MFDEACAIPKAPAHMRTRLFTSLAALWLVAPVGAQTNAPAPRVITLAECIQLALEKNLDIQIRRLQPKIGRAHV